MNRPTASAGSKQNQLTRTLHLPQLVFYGVGTIVGAGVYSVIGAAAGLAGIHLWISFLLAGTAAFLTVLSYAELASALPKVGGEYQFLKRAFKTVGVLAFMAGLLIALNSAATAATVSIAFAGYLTVFVPAPEVLVSLGLLTLCTLVNIAGIRQATWVSIAMICVEVGGLLVLIGTGVFAGAWDKFAFENIWPGHGSAGPPSAGAESAAFNAAGFNAAGFNAAGFNAAGIFAATALIFFVFIGFEDIVNLSEESHKPKTDIPRALLISVGATSLIYLLVALSAVALADPETLESSKSPLETAASTASPLAGKAMAISALFATASTALITLISISRLLFGMARDGAMPKFLATVSAKRHTPWAAALTLFIAACALLPLGRVEIVASISSFGILMVFMLVQASVIRLRYTEPGLARGFRVPLAIGRCPVLPVIGIAMCAALITRFEGIVYLIGGGVIVVGCVGYVVKRR